MCSSECTDWFQWLFLVEGGTGRSEHGVVVEWISACVWCLVSSCSSLCYVQHVIVRFSFGGRIFDGDYLTLWSGCERSGWINERRHAFVCSAHETLGTCVQWLTRLQKVVKTLGPSNSVFPVQLTTSRLMPCLLKMMTTHTYIQKHDLPSIIAGTPLYLFFLSGSASIQTVYRYNGCATFKLS